ncbi:MAG: hypothetical protein WCX69_03130 [Candidatus Paceibacterota bacterium]
MKTKLYSALLIAITGLLLGGNASADGAQLPASATQNTGAQIQQIRERIGQLTDQMQSRRAELSAPVALSQEKLNFIQAQVNVIAKKVERIKIEVSIFVTLRQIREKTAALALVISPSTVAATPVPARVNATVKTPVSTATPTAESMTAAKNDKRAIEEQIAKVKQQIADLTQQLQKKTAANTAAISEAGKCSGSNCAVSSSQTQTGASVAAPVAKTNPVQNKGFWQSVGDFFKKIFTF